MKTTTVHRVQSKKSARGLRHAIRARAVLLGAATLLVSASVTSLHAASNRSDVTPGVLTPQSHPYGRTYGEWIIEWHKFLFSIPLDQNPAFGSTTGAVVGQSGPVAFFVTPFNGGEFNVSLSAGKGLFVPLVLAGDGTCQ